MQVLQTLKRIKKVSENGTGSRSPSKDVGDVGVPPHLNFLEQKRASEMAFFLL